MNKPSGGNSDDTMVRAGIAALGIAAGFALRSWNKRQAKRAKAAKADTPIRSADQVSLNSQPTSPSAEQRPESAPLILSPADPSSSETRSAQAPRRPAVTSSTPPTPSTPSIDATKFAQYVRARRSAGQFPVHDDDVVVVGQRAGQTWPPLTSSVHIDAAATFVILRHGSRSLPDDSAEWRAQFMPVDTAVRISWRQGLNIPTIQTAAIIFHEAWSMSGISRSQKIDLVQRTAKLLKLDTTWKDPNPEPVQPQASVQPQVPVFDPFAAASNQFVVNALTAHGGWGVQMPGAAPWRIPGS